MRPARFAAYAVGLMSLSACRAESTPQAVIYRDSAGIRIVESPASFADSKLPWIVDPTPHLRIGAAESTEPYQLHRVTGATRLNDGRVLIVNAGTQELRFFDEQGEFLKSVGRQGSGPGEFQFPQLGPSRSGDTIWVFDRSQRLVLLDTAGRHLTTITPDARIATPIGVIDGKVLTSDGSARARPDTPEGMMANDLTYELVDPFSASREVIAQVEGIDLFLHNLDGNFGFTVVPFDVSPSAGVGRDRFYITPGKTPEIRAYDTVGQLREIFRVLEPPRPLEQGQFDQVVNAAVARVTDQAQAAELRRRYGSMPKPATIPFYQTLIVDGEDHLWLESYRSNDQLPRQWYVFNTEGILLGRVEMPHGVQVTEIGLDYVLGTTRGADDVEQVVKHRLMRS